MENRYYYKVISKEKFPLKEMRTPKQIVENRNHADIYDCVPDLGIFTQFDRKKSKGLM